MESLINRLSEQKTTGAAHAIWRTIPEEERQQIIKEIYRLDEIARREWDEARFDGYYIDGEDLDKKHSAVWEMNRLVLLILHFFGLQYPQYRVAIANEYREHVLAVEAKERRDKKAGKLLSQNDRIAAVLEWAERYGWPELDLKDEISRYNQKALDDMVGWARKNHYRPAELDMERLIRVYVLNSEGRVKLPLKGFPEDLTLSAGEIAWRRNFSWFPRNWDALIDLVEMRMATSQLNT